MESIFALVDCNNFYVSCERVFAPRLVGRPVIVMSNNDGCVVSRSDEAKALGIGMGQPVFQLQDIVQRHDVATLSSNYALYGDMSRRVMETLGQFTPDLEVYSIDEAFLELGGFRRVDPTTRCRQIQTTVERWTGIPVTIGIAPTKTLAKLANHLAKHSSRCKGVLDLTGSPHLSRALARTPVAQIWGVGPRFARRLQAAGITSALQLRDADERCVRRTRGIQGVRTLKELQGVACYSLEQSPPPRQGIAHTRTFSRRITRLAELQEATATYASRAAEKLRKHGRAAGMVTVYVMTNLFPRRGRRYFNARSFELPSPTADTATIIKLVSRGIAEIHREGCAYKKAGVLLDALVPAGASQAELFDSGQTSRSQQLMQVVDQLNRRFPAGTVTWAATGLERPWQVKFQQRSPRYTSNWSEIPRVLAAPTTPKS